jgi:putative intracellular protease/amidase
MSTSEARSGTGAARTTPPLLRASADNWCLALLLAVLVSALAAANLPASVAFWVVGAMAALVVNAGATVLDEPCVVDGNLITARFPYDLPRMVQAMVKQLVPARA